MNEWEFTADAASWINEILARDASLPFDRAKCEQRGKGSRKRRDLTLLDRHKQACLTGEVKLPYRQDGGSPYNTAVVKDARAKARRAKTRYFFTWNVNEFVLWETSPPGSKGSSENYESWSVTSVRRENHLDLPMTADAIRQWLVVFLHEFARILRGTTQIGLKSPDERFVDSLESSLELPILLNLETLDSLYKKPRFKGELDKWMREEQGWIIYADAEGIRDNLLRASKFACYALVNKLVFHEALLKRFGEKLEKLSIPEHVDTGEGLRSHLESSFAEAKDVTGDYETVFGEEHTGIGNRIPFYCDNAVPHWRQLIEQIHDFDFSKLDYEVIGSIFERLISPEERHKYGQFYTRVEVVDLINSFCIRNGSELVMDPACGGGTFLVRAYARKRELAPGRKHGQLLADLYGIDVSHFATHLTTVNLATRNLIDDENYPQIARSDFFDVEVQKAFLSLPKHVSSKGLGALQHRKVQIPPLDAVVGNPPYVRQEDIPKAKKKKSKNGPEPGTKEYYRDLTNREAKANLVGRSDIHCYFWPHAASFLSAEGYLCLLTSSQWLDVEYGFRLQAWILCNFKILAIFESVDEPWFVGARVATCVTILQRELDDERRMDNCVRFVQLHRPVREILAHDGTTAGAVCAADQFRDEILSLDKDTSNERFRARLVPQRELWTQGVHLGEMMGKSGKTEKGRRKSPAEAYHGGKWGVYLRAPDLWFDLLDTYGEKLVRLGDVAKVRFGVKTGKDCFFFPIDCSDECLETESYPSLFETEYGVPRRLVKSGKVKLVRCGEGRGEIRPIEAKYLEPEVHSLMEVNGFTVGPEDCSRQILLVGKPRNRLKDKYVLDYIAWGEKQGYQKGSTCASRATATRGWYDLTGHERGKLFWPMAQQYKHAIPANDQELICNHNLFDVSPQEGTPDVLGGILNSTWVVLSKFQYGRPVGVEGNLKTEVVDVKMMLVPDPRSATASVRKRIAAAFDRLKQRKALYFLSERRLREMKYKQSGKEAQLSKLSDECELDMPDRRELDDAVLELLGVRPKKRRLELVDELYRYLRQFFEWTRQKEEKAILNKNKTKRRGVARPEEIARQVFEEICEKAGHILRRYNRDFLDTSKPYDVFELPADGVPQTHRDMYDARGVDFKKGKKTVRAIDTKIPEQDPLIILVANSGMRGFVRVPHERDECRRVTQQFGSFVEMRDKTVRNLIEQRTTDEELQERILAALLPLLIR